MLILTRGKGQSIFINDNIEIKVLDILSKSTVRIGISAPKNISVHREEVYQKILMERQGKLYNKLD